MTDEQILRKAIEKAVKNGLTSTEVDVVMLEDVYGLIFSHDFAKAFWGEQTTDYVRLSDVDISFGPNSDGWEYHLQQMVLEENPIKYLEKFL